MSHVEFVQRRFHGALLDSSWQNNEQVTITVRADSAPDIVQHLYYRRGGWLSVVVGNDERPISGK